MTLPPLEDLDRGHQAWHKTRAFHMRVQWHESGRLKTTWIKVGFYCEKCGLVDVDRGAINRAMRTEADRQELRGRP